MTDRPLPSIYMHSQIIVGTVTWSFRGWVPRWLSDFITEHMMRWQICYSGVSYPKENA